MASPFKTENVGIIGSSSLKAISFIIFLAIATVCKAAIPELRFAWKQLDYVWNTPDDRENAINENRYIPSNNLPLGISRWKNKVFVTVPRWKEGVVSSLNYVDFDGPQEQLLKPYPSFEDNYVPDTAEELPSNRSIISVFRIYVDPCDRLWVVDSGAVNILGSTKYIAGPSLAIFDLNTDSLITRHFFKGDDIEENTFFGNIVVDVDNNTCYDAYAYVADIGAYGLMVYSLSQDDSWRVTHEYFYYEALAITYNVAGLFYHWDDGVFGMALTEPLENGYRIMIFHTFSSTKEFYLSTELLRNYRQINTDDALRYIQLLGERGKFTQASTSIYDTNSQVLFYTLVNRNSVGCWNSNKPFTPENNHLIISDPTLLDFSSDLKMDNEDNMWILSDKLPRSIFEVWDPTVINHRIFTIKITDAIAGTACQ